ncbi:MAG TPA: helix-turn-helix transcriptional regulator [Rugosimonospora sp.]|nr:helix-turn-helix transcriptional regulator [Rugosimonospora sp.]
MTGPQGVTLWRRRLGGSLRELREAAGLTREQVGRALDCSSSKISRIENGDVGVRRGDLTVMLNIYGVTDAARREALIELARESKLRGGWWAAHRALLSPPELRYLELESAAVAIDGLGLVTVPDLVQTAEYARADIRASHRDVTEDQVDRLVQVRLTRQELLNGDEHLAVRLILDEAALHRRVGGATVMADQLRHLLKLGARPSVTVQVLPFDRAGAAGVRAGFTLLRFSDERVSGTVYVDGLGGDGLQERPEDVHRADAVFARLRTEALSPVDSLHCIEALGRTRWLGEF